MTGAAYANLIAGYVARRFGTRGLKVYREIRVGKTIIGKNRCVDVLCLRDADARAIAIECKYQDSPAQLVMLPEAATVHLHWLRTKLADYGADVRARALAGLLLPSTAYVTGLRARRWVRSLWPDEYDLLVAPAMPIVAPRFDAIPDDYRLLIMPYHSWAPLLGLPVTVVPCGEVGGLPVALSLTGRVGGDAATLTAAEKFQGATDWHEQLPVDPTS